MYIKLGWFCVFTINVKFYFDQDIWCLNLIQNLALSHTCADLLNGNMLDLKVNGDFLDNIGYTFERINLMTFLNFGILFFIGNSYFKNKVLLS